MKKSKINGCTFKYQIMTDSFTKEKYIYWDEISIDDDFDSNVFDLDYSHYMSFIIKSKEEVNSCYMSFSCGKKKLNIGDTLIFLFADESTLALSIKDKIDGKWVLPIEKTDFEVLAERELKAIRINRIKEKSAEYINFEEYYHKYGSRKKRGAILLNEYTKLFLKIAKEEFGYEPFDREIYDASTMDNADFSQSAQYCYVYLMLDKNTNLYKIGMANNPEQREKTLQSEKPTIEKISEKRLPSREYASAVEKMLHSLYTSKRVRGEWFELSALEIWQISEFFK